MLQHTDILDFWFGHATDDTIVARQQAALWWSKNAQTDATIKQQFEATTLAAAKGELNAWSLTPSGRLALILLTDQLPRNMYRDTPKAFAFDSLALGWCKQGLRQDAHLQLRPIQRVFFYLPLEHSESSADQAQCVQLFETLAGQVDAAQQATFNYYVDFARRHRAIIDRFGRFPHRNGILQRESTAEELEFLQQPGSGF